MTQETVTVDILMYTFDMEVKISATKKSENEMACNHEIDNRILGQHILQKNLTKILKVLRPNKRILPVTEELYAKESLTNKSELTNKKYQRERSTARR